MSSDTDFLGRSGRREQPGGQGPHPSLAGYSFLLPGGGGGGENRVGDSSEVRLVRGHGSRREGPRLTGTSLSGLKRQKAAFRGGTCQQELGLGGWPPCWSRCCLRVSSPHGSGRPPVGEVPWVFTWDSVSGQGLLRTVPPVLPGACPDLSPLRQHPLGRRCQAGPAVAEAQWPRAPPSCSAVGRCLVKV